MALAQEVYQARERASSLRRRLELIASQSEDHRTSKAIKDAMAMDLHELESKLEYIDSIT